MAYRIAIVDDDHVDAEYVGRILYAWAQERQAGVQIQRFASAESFLFNYAEDKAWDILLLDIEMPGGGKKFTIRYDPISDRYWALVNPADPESMKLRHGGIYANGLHAGITRNTLTLISSKDLREWHEERVIITSDNPFFDGFQYVDWQFDGEDIVAVIRLAMEESRGLPNRQHDANFFVFNRILNFRTGNGFTYQINTLHK